MLYIETLMCVSSSEGGVPYVLVEQYRYTVNGESI
jgi:hypothetical protein